MLGFTSLLQFSAGWTSMLKTVPFVYAKMKKKLNIGWSWKAILTTEQLSLTDHSFKKTKKVEHDWSTSLRKDTLVLYFEVNTLITLHLWIQKINVKVNMHHKIRYCAHLNINVKAYSLTKSQLCTLCIWYTQIACDIRIFSMDRDWMRILFISSIYLKATELTCDIRIFFISSIHLKATEIARLEYFSFHPFI